MSVYRPKEAKVYRYDFWVAGVRFSGSTDRTRKAEALKVEADKRDEAKRRASTTEPLTLRIATARYWLEVGQHHANAKTTFADLSRLVDYFGAERQLATISGDDVATLVAWRRGQVVANRKPNEDGTSAPLVSPATVNRSAIEPLKKVFNRAIQDWGAVFPNAPKWKRYKLAEPRERVREVRETEEHLLDSVFEDYRRVADFGRASGLRQRNCLLRKADVDLGAGTIWTVGKGDKRISLPITTEMRAMLMVAMANPTEWVFTYAAERARNPRKPKREPGDPKLRSPRPPRRKASEAHPRHGDRLPITIAGLKSHWRRARKNGLPADLRFHDLRHDFATKLLRETGNLKLVQIALHHSKIETTTKYAHVLDEEVRAGMEAASLARQRKRLANTG